MQMSSKNTTEVIIGGKVFTLGGYESEEYLQKIASYINNNLFKFNYQDIFRSFFNFFYSISLSLI